MVLSRRNNSGPAAAAVAPGLYVRSPGGDRELGVVGIEESDTVDITDIPAGLHDVSKTVGPSSVS